MNGGTPAWTHIIRLAALAGLAPFLGGLVITVFPGLWPLETVIFERALLGYGALILSFLGGVRWGIRMQGGAGTDLTYIVGIAGSVLAFFILLMPYALGIAVLIVAFGAHGAWDVWAGFRGTVPRPYAQLRSMMTWLVCAVLLAILIARAFI